MHPLKALYVAICEEASICCGQLSSVFTLSRLNALYLQRLFIMSHAEGDIYSIPILFCPICNEISTANEIASKTTESATADSRSTLVAL
jgi:hypothetical protein